MRCKAIIDLVIGYVTAPGHDAVHIWVASVQTVLRLLLYAAARWRGRSRSRRY